MNIDEFDDYNRLCRKIHALLSVISRSLTDIEARKSPGCNLGSVLAMKMKLENLTKYIKEVILRTE